MDSQTIALEPHQEPPDGEPYVLHNQASDGLVTITAKVRDSSGALVDVGGIEQPPWPDEEDLGFDIAAELAGKIAAPYTFGRGSPDA